MAEPPERWPDLAGRIEGKQHILPVRVYHEDTDFTGLVYHGALVRFFERGRSDFIRLLGIGHSELLEGAGGAEPAAFVVRHMEIDFLKPAGIGDVLEVVTTIGEIGGATLILVQEVMRDGAVLTRARVKIVVLSRSGKPVRLATFIRGSLERFLNQES